MAFVHLRAEIIEMMRKEPEDTKVQLDGLRALAVLSDPQSTSLESRRTLIHYGVAPLIFHLLDPMETEPRPVLVLPLLKLLANLSTLKEVPLKFELYDLWRYLVSKR